MLTRQLWSPLYYFINTSPDFMDTYRPTVRGLSPRAIEAYRISIECYLSYLAEHEQVGREHVSFEHFQRRYLKGWLTWMTMNTDTHRRPSRCA